jgi:hypothetical protein
MFSQGLLPRSCAIERFFFRGGRRRMKKEAAEQQKQI